MTVTEPGVRRLRAEERLERILTATRELFSEYGDAMSMEQIAKRSGLGVGSLYRRFPSKDDLVRAVAETECRQLEDTAARHAEIYPPAEALFAFLRAWIEGPSLCRALTSTGSLSAVAHHELLEIVMPNIDALLRSAQASGVVRPDAVVTDLFVVIVAVRMVADRGGAAGKLAARRQLELLIDALRPGAEPLRVRPLRPSELVTVFGQQPA
jgi:AcrR family transcriptional regulator